MTTDLKPCPFCGSKRLSVRNGFVSCMKCGVDGPDGEDESEGIDIWNSRVAWPAPDAAGLVAALEYLAQELNDNNTYAKSRYSTYAHAALAAYRAAAQPDAGSRPTGEVDRLLELARGYGHEGHGSAALDCVIAAIAALAQERHS